VGKLYIKIESLIEVETDDPIAVSELVYRFKSRFSVPEWNHGGLYSFKQVALRVGKFTPKPESKPVTTDPSTV
jgi:hypothetical protein